MQLHRQASYGAVTIATVALFAAACGGSSSGGSAKVNAGNSSNVAAVTTHSSPDGTYLTDGKGLTVYLFSKDTGSTSACTGDCTKEWRPFTTSGTPTASGSAQGSMVGTTSRGGGVTQVTYAGHPLYYYADDKAAGDMKGQGLDDFGGLWSAVTPAGQPLTTSTPSSTPSSGGSSGTSEWG